MSVHQSALHTGLLCATARKELTVQTHTYYNTTKSCLRCATTSTTAAPHLALLGLFLSLGLSAPSAAPLLQRLLGLRRQAGRRRRHPVPALDQTQAGVHAGQVVPACMQNIQDGITSGTVQSAQSEQVQEDQTVCCPLQSAQVKTFVVTSSHM